MVLAADVAKQHDAEVFEAGLKPKWSVAQLADKGVRSYAQLDGDAMASAIRFIGDEGEEHWLGLHNFYVITRYNHSSMYAMAVYQLSQLVAQRYTQ